MTTTSSRATDEISALYDGWVAAIRNKDLTGALSHYSPDSHTSVPFDTSTGLASMNLKP